MYLYWIVITKVPVDKLNPLSKYLSQFAWFGGIRLVDNGFPKGIATIQFRIRKEGKAPKTGFPASAFDSLPPLKSKIVYHTPENEDTWKMAHVHYDTNKDKKKKNDDFMTLYKNGVLILGKDSGEYLIELLKVKKLLINKGYKNAKLLKLLRDIPNQSLPQKLRLWGLLCRFSIIVDRKPAGHLNEFELLKSQDTIVAILRPRGFKSTSMMESHPKSKLIKIFEFRESPIEIMDDVIKWAEKVTEENKSYYNKAYRWKKDYL